MESSAIKYCPSCGKNLEKIDILDVHEDGFRCSNDHYLYSMKEEVYSGQTMDSYLDLKSDKESPEEILKEWLSNPRLRDHLNDNLAGIIRFILERKNGKRTTEEQQRYDYCTICGEILQNVPTDDLYVAILKCKNEHTFLSRGGLRSIGSELKTGIFSFDYDEKYFQMSCNSWMKNKHYAEYFPHELRLALQSVLQG